MLPQTQEVTVDLHGYNPDLPNRRIGRYQPFRFTKSRKFRLMRNCFFGGAMHAVLLLQNGHGDQLAADFAGFITGELHL